jgi:hypothetical protein
MRFERRFHTASTLSSPSGFAAARSATCSPTRSPVPPGHARVSKEEGQKNARRRHDGHQSSSISATPPTARCSQPNDRKVVQQDDGLIAKIWNPG